MIIYLFIFLPRQQHGAVDSNVGLSVARSTLVQYENISRTVGWIAKKYFTGIPVAQGRNPTHFGDPVTFLLAPPLG